jgi:cytochrome b561
MAIDILGAENTVRAHPGRRYTETAQALHWITAALMFAVIPIAWVMVSLPRTAANR